MIKFYIAILLTLLIQYNATASDLKSTESKSKEILIGEDIAKGLNNMELFAIDQNASLVEKGNIITFDPKKNYTIDYTRDLCPHSWRRVGEDDYCDEKTNICECQSQESESYDAMDYGDDIRFGELVIYYKDDNVRCESFQSNHHSCYLIKDENGKVATITPSKFNLKQIDDPNYNKECFVTEFEVGSKLKVYFEDKFEICKNAKKKFDKKKNKTYIDCAEEQRKLKAKN